MLRSAFLFYQSLSWALAQGNSSGVLLLIVIEIPTLSAIKANVSPMIAEQYTGKLRKETLPSGEIVIKSPAVTIQSIYLCT